MKIQYFSDMHVNLEKDQGEAFFQSIKPVGDVILVAGDFTSFADHSKTQLHSLFKRLTDIGPPVIYVMGNHDYWGSSFPIVQKALETLQEALPELRVLEPGKVVTIGTQRFLGGTMWFPKKNTPAFRQASNNFPDFWRIQNFNKYVYHENDKFLDGW